MLYEIEKMILEVTSGLTQGSQKQMYKKESMWVKKMNDSDRDLNPEPPLMVEESRQLAIQTTISHTQVPEH